MNSSLGYSDGLKSIPTELVKSIKETYTESTCPNKKMNCLITAFKWVSLEWVKQQEACIISYRLGFQLAACTHSQDCRLRGENVT